MLNSQQSNNFDESQSPHYKAIENEFGRSEYKIALVSRASESRNRVERFMYESYQKHFSAELKTFSPIILAVFKKSDHSIVSALGLSYADEGKLFSEAYLVESIDQQIAQHELIKVNRSKIIELNSFVIDKTINIKNVLPQICNFIKSLDVDWTVYTLTKIMKRYFHRFGISLSFLSLAEQSALQDSSDWGNYYNFEPAVYYSSVRRN